MTAKKVVEIWQSPSVLRVLCSLILVLVAIIGWFGKEHIQWQKQQAVITSTKMDGMRQSIQGNSFQIQELRLLIDLSVIHKIDSLALRIKNLEDFNKTRTRTAD